MIGIKKCTKCGVEKKASDFYQYSKSKDGLQPWCKQCTKKENALWYKKHKSYAQERHRVWARNNTEKRKEYYEKYKELNKEKIKAQARARYYANIEESRRKNRESAKRNALQRKLYLQKNKEKVRKWVLKSYEKNKEKRQLYQQEYRTKNKALINAKRMDRLKSDPVYARKERLRLAIRAGIKTAKNGGKHNKTSLLKTVTGLSSNELWNYLLSTWQKRYNSVWSGEQFHIDHITPLCTAKDLRSVDQLFHYTNLQMLTPEDNTTKKKRDLKYAE